ncbi:hypothetical protein GCM10010964_42830 [Caldovatus sediminis]|uniref:Uncharacterized protein n=1 Tax=Caldovatus sediminis TaxID=2041189 RepID=A0A8J3EE59_9PROT|nr:hypothetical protein [Caldovatus sediminis]GGG50997.1 hypothetical protein GCM10010964_42830 [Caldovatus sediminis]
MLRNILAGAPLILLLASGCGGSSGVLQLGPDTYRSSAEAHPLAGGTAAAEQTALEAAQRHCASLHRAVLVQDIGTAPATSWNNARASVSFRCLAAGDPELRRPTLERAPNVIIEDRRGR